MKGFTNFVKQYNRHNPKISNFLYMYIINRHRIENTSIKVLQIPKTTKCNLRERLIGPILSTFIHTCKKKFFRDCKIYST